jgi:hypothetical protein
LDSIFDKIFNEQPLLYQKLKNTEYDFYYISEDSINYSHSLNHENTQVDLSDLQNAWRNIRRVGYKGNSRSKPDWSLINTVGDRPPSFHNPLIWHFRNDPSGKWYFILIGDPKEFPWYEINLLMNYLKIDNGFLPVHACGVVRHDSLFLFGGPSGVGKSTLAKLSNKLDGDILDEDQILI